MRRSGIGSEGSSRGSYNAELLARSSKRKVLLLKGTFLLFAPVLNPAQNMQGVASDFERVQDFRHFGNLRNASVLNLI